MKLFLIIIGVIIGVAVILLSLLGSAIAIENIFGPWFGYSWAAVGILTLFFICGHCEWISRKK
jgi:hypothetical protein